MRRTGWMLRMTAMLAAVGMLSACYEWTARPGDLRATLGSLPPDNRVRVVRLDGRVETLSRPRLVGDTLAGLVSGVAWDNQFRRIPLDSIAGLREERFDGPGTAKAVIATVAGGAVVFLIGVAIALGSIRD